jgi:hypothetical protein
MHSHKSLQLLGFASLSLPHFDANPFWTESGEMPDFCGLQSSPADRIDGIGPSIMGFSQIFESNTPASGMKRDF